MANRIIVLSGPVASGKTTLGDTLVERYGFQRQKTRELIRHFQKTELEREALQVGGDALDRKTRGRWVADALGRAILDLSPNSTVLVDSVRIEAQVKAIRQAFGSNVTHVHLTAPLAELARRYRKRPKHLKELSTYEEVRANATERNVDNLTFADYFGIKNRQARRFEQLNEDTIRFVEELERVAVAPVSLIATRFNFRSIIDRRKW